MQKKAGRYKGRSKCLTNEQIDEIHNLVVNRYKKSDIAKKIGISHDTLYCYLKFEVKK